MSKSNISPKDQRTKRRIQETLKLSGPLDALQLSKELGLTAMAIRQHLYALSEESIVNYQEVSRPKGRPAKLWNLTIEANKLFPDTHAELSIGLIDSMKQVFGEEGLEKLIQQRANDQLETYKAHLASHSNLQDKLQAFANKRSSEGYMAQIEPTKDGSFLFIENHCPICAAAASCSRLCDAELDIIETLFPENDIQREEHILHQSRRCCYKISN